MAHDKNHLDFHGFLFWLSLISPWFKVAYIGYGVVGLLTLVF
jgi:hypothetical protein